MKKLFQISFLAIALFTISAVSQEAAAQKIAVVDTEALLAASPAVKRANSQLQTLKKQFENRLKAKSDQAQQKYTQAMQDAQAGKLSENQQKAVGEELMKMQEDLVKLERKMQEDLLKKEEALMKPILEDLRANITSVAQAKGYRYVFNKNAMIYHPPADDITSDVKQKLGYK